MTFSLAFRDAGFRTQADAERAARIAIWGDVTFAQRTQVDPKRRPDVAFWDQRGLCVIAVSALVNGSPGGLHLRPLRPPRPEAGRAPMSAVLLFERDGETVGIRFPSVEDARAWEDAQGADIPGTVVGCVRLVTRREAIR